jgi:hypothetical protein
MPAGPAVAALAATPAEVRPTAGAAVLVTLAWLIPVAATAPTEATVAIMDSLRQISLPTI